MPSQTILCLMKNRDQSKTLQDINIFRLKKVWLYCEISAGSMAGIKYRFLNCEE